MAKNNKIEQSSTIYPRFFQPSLLAIAVSSCLMAPAFAQESNENDNEFILCAYRLINTNLFDRSDKL